MTNNIKLSARKTSFILAVSCILFSVIATYLYINHQIDLTRYTTPIILGTVVIIITCGGLQRVFYIFLTDECPQIFSDNQRNSIPDMMIRKKSKFWSNNLPQKLNPKLFHISRDSKAVWKKFRRKNWREK